MKAIFTILFSFLTITLIFSQDSGIRFKEQCRFYLPTLNQESSNLNSNLKRLYIKQWEVISTLFRNQEFIMVYRDENEILQIKHAFIIEKVIKHRRNVFIQTMDFNDHNEPQKLIDIFSPLLIKSQFYFADCK